MGKRKSVDKSLGKSSKSKKSKTEPLSEDDIAQFRAKNDITLESKNSEDIKGIAPIMSFKSLRKSCHKSSKPLIEFMKSKFPGPTPIQSEAWALGHTDKDLVAIAQTGSGKTLAFSIPILSKLLKAMHRNKSERKENRKCTPKVMILSPTRELCIQSFNVVQELCAIEEIRSQFDLQSVVVYGGTKRWEQKKNLTSSVDIVIATIGRLKDFVSSQDIDLKDIEFIVLDEADRLLDQGFERDVIEICNEYCQNLDKQTYFFSATWPEEVQKVANKILKPDFVSIKIGKEELTANKKIDQSVVVCERMAKDRMLVNTLEEHPNQKVIIFCLYKKECARVEDNLRRVFKNVSGIHGDKTQDARESALKSFETSKCSYLVATDVASRGLDIKDVDLVLNYTFPLTIEDYVHRIGRTARGSRQTGKSITFFTQDDKHLAGSLQNILRQNDMPVPEDLKKFGNTVKKKVHSMYGAHCANNSEDAPLKKSTHIKF